MEHGRGGYRSICWDRVILGEQYVKNSCYLRWWWRRAFRKYSIFAWIFSLSSELEPRRCKSDSFADALCADIAKRHFGLMRQEDSVVWDGGGRGYHLLIESIGWWIPWLRQLYLAFKFPFPLDLFSWVWYSYFLKWCYRTVECTKRCKGSLHSLYPLPLWSSKASLLSQSTIFLSRSIVCRYFLERLCDLLHWYSWTILSNFKCKSNIYSRDME